jgi:ABC-2 type transport system ATP-binding protein
MIEVSHLTKEFGDVVAVRDISFSVPEGKVVGFLGPNGAGKTTTLRILAGFMGPSAGRVRICGKDIQDEPIEARRALGYMPESPALYPELRVSEYLSYRAALKLLPRSERRAAIARAAELARVDSSLQTLLGHLSKGYRQRVALADALLGKPPVLILDEPTAGLDPNQIRDVRELVRGLEGEHTVLLSTHILSEVEAMCEQAIVIHQGELVAQGPLAKLLEQASPLRLRLSLRDEAGRAATVLGAFGEILSEQRQAGGLVELEIELYRRGAGEDPREAVLAAATAAGLHLREAVPVRKRLEELFTSLTTQPRSLLEPSDPPLSTDAA